MASFFAPHCIAFASAIVLALVVSGCRKEDEEPDAVVVSSADSHVLTTDEVAQLRRRALAGDVAAMHTLAVHYVDGEEGEAAEGVLWLKRAARAGDCHAVRLLNGQWVTMPEAERQHWRNEDRRLRCSIPVWTRANDQSIQYRLPGETLWIMRVSCTPAGPEVAGPAGATPSEASTMTYRTSSAVHQRRISRVRHNFAAVAYRPSAADEVLEALLTGQTVQARFFPDAEPWEIDGRGSASLLRPVIEACRAM